MRELPEELAARLAGGVTTLAHVLRITRADGQVFGFTDHDRTLVFGGVSCAPGVEIGALEKSLGLGVDTASLAGALSSDAITEEDLARGLWDGAQADLFRVDWTDPDLYAHLFSGRIGEVRRGVSAFEAELRGLQAPLNTPVGRVFSRFCDADVGDARCGVDLNDAAFRGEGAVVEMLSDVTFRASGLGAFAADWFARGRVAWQEGGVSEVAAHTIESGDAILELVEPTEAVTDGAAFVVTAGCDKRFATCRTKFANTLNFRGFPHMPGNDAIQSGPDPGDRLDGSSRFS